MELLGVGPAELAFVVVLALILLGPKDMVAAGRTLGKTLRKIVTSPTWKAVRTTSQELQRLPTRLMREAGLDELKDLEKDIRESTQVSIDPRLTGRGIEDEQPSGESNTPDLASPAVGQDRDETSPSEPKEDSQV